MLDTCRENVQFFFTSIGGIFGDFSRAAPQLPRQQQFLCGYEDRAKPELHRGGFVRAQKYRNAMIHNPVLGRAADVTREMLPHWTALKKVERWRAAEQLGPDQWIDVRDLFESLYQDITRFLQHEWQRIIDAMEELRYKPQYAPKFKRKWALLGFVPISEAKIRIRLDRAASPTLTSGTAFSPTAVVPRQLTFNSIPPAPPDSEISAAEANEEPKESK